MSDCAQSHVKRIKETSGVVAATSFVFFERDVLEVDTPLLCQHGVTDRHIENLSTRDSQHNLRYLQTSPEYAMKRLLAQYGIVSIS